MKQVEIILSARRRGCHLITGDVVSRLPELPDVGLLHLFVCHTSCGLTINENCDPDVRSDMSRTLDRIVPENPSLYDHTDEGPDDMPSHCKSTIVGTSVTIPIRGRRLALGTWQGIYLCEFRNYGGERRLIATIME